MLVCANHGTGAFFSMTIKEVLDLPENLEKLSDAELEKYLGPLVPQARMPDKERAEIRDNKNLLNLAARLIEQNKR